MKSWKDVPNLFANGKFRINHPEYSNLPPFNPYWLYQFTRDEEWNDCTLIARKIEDLSEDELKIHREKQICIPDMEGVYRFRETPESFLYLLSIGVYPFEQSHFKDGTVININTITDK